MTDFSNLLFSHAFIQCCFLCQASEDVLAAHKACTMELVGALPNVGAKTRVLAATLITSLEQARDCTW